MAKIFFTQTQSNRSRFLLRAGLSIFLFLQIQKPDAARSTSEQLTILTIKEISVSKEIAQKPGRHQAVTVSYSAKVGFEATPHR